MRRKELTREMIAEEVALVLKSKHSKINPGCVYCKVHGLSLAIAFLITTTENHVNPENPIYIVRVLCTNGVGEERRFYLTYHELDKDTITDAIYSIGQQVFKRNLFSRTIAIKEQPIRLGKNFWELRGKGHQRRSYLFDPIQIETPKNH